MNTSKVLLLLVLLAFKAKGTNWKEFVHQVDSAIIDAALYTLPTNNDKFFSVESSDSDEKEEIIEYGSFDIIIIGGGTAGAVLANRLTDGDLSVLVIEAGGDNPAWTSVLGLSSLTYYTNLNWGYNTTRQKTSCLGMVNEKCFYPRGKTLGGSSVISAGLYVRGNAKDYNEWEKLGNPGWSYKDCLPYFKKSESAKFSDYFTIDKDYHGFDGLQGIDIPLDTEGLTANLIEAAKTLGKKEIDYNGSSQDGIGRMQFYLDDTNIRASSSYDYIKPAGMRTNLGISLESLVTKIVFSEGDDKIAKAVEFVSKGQKYIAKVLKEVIVSAGSINSPQVLMLSGIGPTEELEKYNISVIADLPVGKNLYDHVVFPGVCFRTNQTFNKQTFKESLDLWKEAKRPLVGGFGVHVVGYLSPENEVLLMHANPNWGSTFQFKDEYRKAFETLDVNADICAMSVLLKPQSVGEVTLQSKDPKDFPLINPNYYSNIADLEAMNKAVQETLKLLETEQFKAWNASLVEIPIPDCDTYQRLDADWWMCALKYLSSTLFHPIGTTRMGSDPNESVVDSDLKVHGFDNLRVVDAGVIPLPVAGHLNAPVVMIAEKIADVIKEFWTKK